MALGRLVEGGWLCVRSGSPSIEARLRVEERANGRLAIVEMWLCDPQGISGAALRDLPLGRWEASLNAPGTAEEVRGQLQAQATSGTDAIAKLWDKLPAAPDQPAEYLTDDGLHLVTRVEASFPATWHTEPTLALEIAPGHKHPDDFYKQVATAYSWLAGRSRRPAEELAQVNGVPKTTIHRWVKEARRRGLLGPGRKQPAEASEHADADGGS